MDSFDFGGRPSAKHGPIGEAVEDTLATWWDEDDDASIVDASGREVVRFLRDDSDHDVAHVYYMADERHGPMHKEVYRSEKVVGTDGRVRTLVTVLE